MDLKTIVLYWFNKIFGLHKKNKGYYYFTGMYYPGISCNKKYIDPSIRLKLIMKPNTNFIESIMVIKNKG